MRKLIHPASNHATVSEFAAAKNQKLKPASKPDVRDSPRRGLHLEEHAIEPTHPDDEIHAAIEVGITEIETAAVLDTIRDPVNVNVITLFRLELL